MSDQELFSQRGAGLVLVDVVGTVSSKFAKGTGGPAGDECQNLIPEIVGAIAADSFVGVRRLTPRECERLQGIPDDYTLIPFRGKPATDGNRYKAIGNGMAVPCVRWILRRIDRAFTSAGSWRRDPEISRGFSPPATSI